MKHAGSCHCAKIQFEVEMDLKKAISCNCTICLKRGSLLDFVPESNFNLLSGAPELKVYTFNKKKIQHFFCKDCGILPFGKAAAPDGTKMVAINIRCIEAIDLSKIQIQDFDGRSI